MGKRGFEGEGEGIYLDNVEAKQSRGELYVSVKNWLGPGGGGF